jgi:hypothetical protein
MLTTLLASACAALVLTACGGTPEGDASEFASTASSQTVAYANSRSALTDNTFGNFNPSIWNNRSWYECNCARDQSVPAPSTPWKAGNN